jgi:hypothetical protein
MSNNLMFIPGSASASRMPTLAIPFSFTIYGSRNSQQQPQQCYQALDYQRGWPELPDDEGVAGNGRLSNRSVS